MEPDSRKAFGQQPGIDLFVEKVGDRSVVEIDRHDRTPLTYQPHVFDQQRISGGRDCEAADFGGAEVAPKQHLRPRRRGEP